MKIITLVALALVVLTTGSFAQSAKLEPKDLAVIEGSKWIGTLTYLDYSSNKKTLIKSNLTVSKAAGEKNVWIFDYEYPDEPKANSKDRVILSENGKTLDGETVSEVTKTKIVTLKAGTDNGLTAIFRFTYEFGKDRFSIRKEVKPEGSVDYFERNTYSWTRTK